MGLVAIQEQSLIDIGNSLRSKLGETKIIYSDEIVPVVKVSKSPNAISFTEWDGQYANRSGSTEIITIEGATKLKIKMAYQTFNNYADDYISITEGTEPNTSYSYEHRYYGKELKTVELEFNGDTVVFYLRIQDAIQDRNALGYYAEVTGYDADGNVITEVEGEKEVRNEFRAQDMASAIDSIEVLTLPDEAFVISGQCNYKYAYNGWNWFIDMFGDKITTHDLTNTSYMFANSNLITEIPFVLNFTNNETLSFDLNNMFQSAGLTKVPYINMPNATKVNMTNLFNGCSRLTDANGLFVNEDDWIASWQNSINTTQFSSQYSNGIFQHCYGLRSLPNWFYQLKLNPESIVYPYNGYLIYGSMLYYCYLIDEVTNLPVWKCKGYLTSNAFSNTFNNAGRLKRFTFETNEDGSPIVTEWKAQTIDLTQNVGYLIGTYNATSNGISADKEVKDDTTYQALKDDADWFTCNMAYSRYNHDSAVNTINSLPDTSAYLASAGGTNTIKFKGAAGELTDGGAINTLTAEEIAVATARGWTVTFV